MLLFVFSSCSRPADDGNYYEVRSDAFPELTFHVKQNANPRILGSYTDDYSEKVFDHYAEQYDISWTVNETGDNVTVTYSDYQSIDEFAKRLEGLIMDYDAAGLYGSFYTISSVKVFPEEKWQSYVKGAAIELKAAESSFGNIDIDNDEYNAWMQSRELFKNIGTICMEDITQGKLAEQLKLHYIYSIFNYTFPTEEP